MQTSCQVLSFSVVESCKGKVYEHIVCPSYVTVPFHETPPVQHPHQWLKHLFYPFIFPVVLTFALVLRQYLNLAPRLSSIHRLFPMPLHSAFLPQYLITSPAQLLCNGPSWTRTNWLLTADHDTASHVMLMSVLLPLYCTPQQYCYIWKHPYCVLDLGHTAISFDRAVYKKSSQHNVFCSSTQPGQRGTTPSSWSSPDQL